MNEELESEIKEMIKNNLQITVEKKSGYFDNLKDYYKIELIFDNEVICTAYT